jgi:hypothetical protein
MQFEISERIVTDRSATYVLDHALIQFKKVADSAKICKDGQLVVKSIEATFGSINRADKTIVSAREVDDGVLVVADVRYRPSVAFWILLIVLAFTWIGWILPIIFYLSHKNTVRKAIESCLQRVNNECARAVRPIAAPAEAKASAMDELGKLAELKERGFVTDEEFAAKKLQLLRTR